MGTVSSLTKKVTKLESKLGVNFREYATVRAVQKFAGNLTINWRKLKKYCVETNLTIIDVEDPLCGEVKSYPAKAWKEVYGVNLETLF